MKFPSVPCKGESTSFSPQSHCNLHNVSLVSFGKQRMPMQTSRKTSCFIENMQATQNMFHILKYCGNDPNFEQFIPLDQICNLHKTSFCPPKRCCHDCQESPCHFPQKQEECCSSWSSLWQGGQQRSTSHLACCSSNYGAVTLISGSNVSFYCLVLC